MKKLVIGLVLFTLNNILYGQPLFDNNNNRIGDRTYTQKPIHQLGTIILGEQLDIATVRTYKLKQLNHIWLFSPNANVNNLLYYKYRVS